MSRHAPDSNPGPLGCEPSVLTTTLRGVCVCVAYLSVILPYVLLRLCQELRGLRVNALHSEGWLIYSLYHQYNTGITYNTVVTADSQQNQ